MMAIGRDMGRLRNLATVFSQFLNVLLLNGDPDETVSGRAYREGILGGNEKWARIVEIIDRVFFLHDQHCRGSYRRDVKFARNLAKEIAEAHGLDPEPADRLFAAALQDA